MNMLKIVLLNLCLAFLGTSITQAQETVDSIRNVQQSRGEIGINKGIADEAYANGDYQLAIQLYEQILETQGEAAAIYYNLGNSYYKGTNIAKAILNYERALLLAPGDADIRFNLDLAKSKTVDKITPLSEIFFITWIKSIANLLNSDVWAIIAVVFFLSFIFLICIYLFVKKLVVRKFAFFLSLLSLLLCVVSNFAASYQKGIREDKNSAIVMQPSVTIKSTPDNSGTDLFILHEGCKVEIKDNSMREWKEIRLEDGNVGWIPANAIEII